MQWILAIPDLCLLRLKSDVCFVSVKLKLVLQDMSDLTLTGNYKWKQDLLTIYWSFVQFWTKADL